MAEIDRIKALAGLLVLDDEDDDLFPSSPSAGSNVDDCPNRNLINESPFNESVSATKAVVKGSGDQIRHGVVKNQQHDDILREMQQKGFLGQKNALAKKGNLNANTNIAHDNSNDDPGKTDANTTRLSLSIVIDEPCDEELAAEIANSGHDKDQLVFGRPQTFGAAGGYETNYMPNVKQRAVAISAWKILEMKKEKKNGHARAREWKVGEEREEDPDSGYHIGEDEKENGMTFPRNENYSKDHGKKTKIPSFLSHFDNVQPTHGDEENSINGVACQPITPRSGRGSRVPLSPRVSSLSTRNVGVSPRNILSPRNIMSPREALLKMEASRFPSPRNTTKENIGFSPRNEVLSPRSKALLSPSRANKVHRYSLDANSNIIRPGSLAHFHGETLTTTNAMPSNEAPVNKKKQMPMDEAGGNQELSSILERRFVENGVESALSKPTEACDHNSVGVSSMGKTDLKLKTVEMSHEIPSSLETNQNDQKDRHNVRSKFEKNKNNDPRETHPVRVEKVSGSHGKAENMPSSAVDKTIHDTLEEASRFLQNAKQASDISNEESLNDGCNNDSMDFQFDEQLLSARELARALDKFLVEDDSMEDDASMQNEEKTFSMEDVNNSLESKRKVTMDDVKLNEVNKRAEDKVGFDESKRKMFEQEQTNEWGQWNLSDHDDTKEKDLEFPTDFEDLTGDQCASTLATSIDDSFFPVAFDEENIPQFIAPGSKPTRSCDASKSSVQRKRKLPKIKISIEGAPIFKAEDNAMNKASPMFFFSQPSPSCGDNAGLLQTQHSFDTPTALFDGKEKKESSKKHYLPLNNPTKRLNIKEFISHSFPSKHERDKSGLSPSMAGLLEMNHNETVMDMDEHIDLVSVRQLANLTPKTHQFEHFFVGPISSPTSSKAGTPRKPPSSPMLSGSLVVQPALCISPTHKNSTPGRDKKKKITNSSILQRIKSPLLNGKKMGSAGLHDGGAFGRH